MLLWSRDSLIYIHQLYQLYKPFQSQISYQSHPINYTTSFPQSIILYLELYISKNFSYSSPIRNYSLISYINHISHISHILLFAQSILSKLFIFHCLVLILVFKSMPIQKNNKQPFLSLIICKFTKVPILRLTILVLMAHIQMKI